MWQDTPLGRTLHPLLRREVTPLMRRVFPNCPALHLPRLTGKCDLFALKRKVHAVVAVATADECVIVPQIDKPAATSLRTEDARELVPSRAHHHRLHIVV